MVIHLANAALTHRAVVSTIRLDAAALGALEEDLAFAKAQLLDHFLGGVTFWD
jgi:hypothetical protein